MGEKKRLVLIFLKGVYRSGMRGMARGERKTRGSVKKGGVDLSSEKKKVCVGSAGGSL